MILIDNQTASVTATYLEPIANPDGGPLQDLAYTSVYYRVNGGPVIVGAKTTATAVRGGGSISTTLIVTAPTGGTTTLLFYATATDLTGNESLPTPTVEFMIERIAPSSPVSFTIA